MTQPYSARLDSALGHLSEAASEVQRALGSPYPDYQYVQSSDGSTAYLVKREWTCTCPGWQYRRTCRHIDEVLRG